MQDFVSTRWIRVSGLAASLAIALAMFAFSGAAWMAWMSLVSVGVAMSGSLWMASRSNNRSVQEMIADLEGEPVRAVARMPFVAPPRNTIH
jgi:hypothetical protein